VARRWRISSISWREIYGAHGSVARSENISSGAKYHPAAGVSENQRRSGSVAASINGVGETCVALAASGSVSARALTAAVLMTIL